MSSSRGRVERSPLEVAALVLLALVPIAVALRLAFAHDPTRQNVYLKVFVPAAEAFAAAKDLYVEQDTFRYPPLAAAAFVPFAACGPLLGGILWRFLMWALFLVALRAAFRAGFPFALTSRERALFVVGVLPLAAANLNMGQPNVLVLAGLLWATVRLGRGGVGPAAAVVGTTIFKVYPLAHGLVLGVLRPRLWLWLLVLLALAAALPFVLQDPDYVWRQYVALFEMLRAEDRTQPGAAFAYRDLRLLVAATGAELPGSVFQLLQLLGGGAIALVCHLLRRRGVAEERVLDHAFALTMCWFELLGPSTEKVTYLLFAPVLMWGALEAWRGPGRGRWLWGVPVALYVIDQILPQAERADQLAHPWLRCASPAATAVAAVLLAMRALADLRGGVRPVAGGASNH